LPAVWITALTYDGGTTPHRPSPPTAGHPAKLRSGTSVEQVQTRVLGRLMRPTRPRWISRPVFTTRLPVMSGYVNRSDHAVPVHDQRDLGFAHEFGRRHEVIAAGLSEASIPGASRQPCERGLPQRVQRRAATKAITGNVWTKAAWLSARTRNTSCLTGLFARQRYFGVTRRYSIVPRHKRLRHPPLDAPRAAGRIGRLPDLLRC